MIVEFVGVSGVGKTTVAREFYGTELEKGKRIAWPRYQLYMKTGWLKRNFIKSASVLRVLSGNPDWAREAMRIFKRLQIATKDRFILLFNYLSYKDLFEKSDDPRCEYLFDEGVIQLIWAAYLRTRLPVSEECVGQIIKLFQAPDRLIVVDADTKVIAERLRARGTKTRILESRDLCGEIETMKGKLKAIIEFAVTSGAMDGGHVEAYDNSAPKDAFVSGSVL